MQRRISSSADIRHSVRRNLRYAAMVDQQERVH